MNKLMIFVLLLLFGCGEQEKYAASDCITRIEFQWKGESEREKAEITTEFMDSFIRQYIADNGVNLPPPSSAVQGAKREFIFLQYTGNCSSKTEITKLIVNKVLLASKSLPAVTFTDKAFKSGYDTILVDGPYWESD